jgi:hypothetical protein
MSYKYDRVHYYSWLFALFIRGPDCLLGHGTPYVPIRPGRYDTYAVPAWRSISSIAREAVILLSVITRAAGRTGAQIRMRG